jgi:proteic killer suppression protein
LDEQFAVDISRNERLVFEVADDPIPRKPDGGIDLERVTEIRVLRIEDYHGN